MPLRRAVTKVAMLPEVDAWMRAVRKDGAITQVAVMAGESVREGGRCYWPVEVRLGETVWRRYLVTPDGKRVIGAAAPRTAASPPAASRPAAPTPAPR